MLMCVCPSQTHHQMSLHAQGLTIIKLVDANQLHKLFGKFEFTSGIQNVASMHTIYVCVSSKYVLYFVYTH